MALHSFPCRGGVKNPETTTEMHLSLLLELELGPPRMASFLAQGKGVRRKVGGPSPRCTQLSTERDGQTATALCPGLSCSSLPHPHCPRHATTTRDCSIATPTPRFHLEPQGHLAGLPTRFGPKVSRLQLVEVLSDFRQEASW
uniref:Uncharacterized protein n=1 Tax=Pipistrellus kuhlii TaxID=59472 RepID=A0A7J7S6H8_PIPKU|nr:hypothetical protein mPipKuh1_010022 [Pipistrellus kuhlii]